MKSLFRLGVLAAIVAGLAVLAAPGGIQQPDLVSAATGHNLTVEVDDASSGVGHQFLAAKVCGPGSALLDDGQLQVFSCPDENPGAWTLIVNPAPERTLASVACSVTESNTNGADSDISGLTGTAGTYNFTIVDGEDVHCLFTFSGSGSNGGGGSVGALGQLAIAVVADPNVIPCGGTAVITATARDINGHIVDGVGYHFSTDVGQLNVGPPNTAMATDGIATLTLQPGMTQALVKVWVGPLGYTPSEGEPAEVVVQQFCPGVTTENHESLAPGAIALSASTNTVTCGETIFIGARVRDSKNQVVTTDTVVSFIASAGEFQTGAGVVTDYSAGGDDASASQTLNTVSQYNTTTSSGVMNLTYIAPSYPGEVTITAAAGDKFSKLVLQVNCAYTPVYSGGSTSQPSCTPIGDGICISAPSTGSRITPPSTGEAGLK